MNIIQNNYTLKYIEKANIVHNYLYDYSKVIINKSRYYLQ